MEDLESIWKKLSLNEENAGVNVHAGSSVKVKSKGDCSLIGKICSNCTKGKEVVRAMMIKIWKVSRPPVFTQIRANIFIITFANSRDKRRVLDGCPSLFDNLMFVLKSFDGLTQPTKINFDLVSLQVHMHNLPLSCMTYDMGEQIGIFLKRVEEVDAPKDDVGWESYLRVKVKVEVDLRKARRTIEVGEKKLWVPFTYDKLPKLCFKCGCIVYREEGCALSHNLVGDKKNQFGPWLRVSGGPQGNFRERMVFDEEEERKEEQQHEQGVETEGVRK
ncbi:hypothetical protein F2P56_012474 [Juglans regia]|uniref:Uncharacterized protein LOC109010277 n=2 Tax=Juglans regia TaxID=51240 RepID=A0A2I4GRS0_JUGRE|nr:uncharacterized protein LOC109010277 [Juglans regia]KAF5468312.1 hypothetical protein F2P56_012474 [Juglans regia]